MNMQNKNDVRMIVNLGTNPTVRTTFSGQKVARFSAAAVEHDATTGKNKVKWYAVVSWGRVAEIAEMHLQKGKRVLLCGNLVIRHWTDKKGNARTKSEIVATDLVLLHSGRTPAANIAA